MLNKNALRVAAFLGLAIFLWPFGYASNQPFAFELLTRFLYALGGVVGLLGAVWFYATRHPH